MVLHTTTKNVETNMTGAGAFTIKASAKAFKILSDGLYSDKIKAVIRELSCNGLDSHTAAGKTDTPIEVHLPNSLEQWFSVRDFGLGLSRDGIMSLYTTYFESTKTDSNDQIGALGLGSKSPFSYTDSFTVVSNYNGIKSTYVAYIGSNGEPAIQHLVDVDTDECNGVEVKFPVKKQDINSFLERAELVYRPFKVKPTITGNSAYKEKKRGEITYQSEKGDWTIYEGNYWNTKQFAIQGNIEYVIDEKVLSDVMTAKSAFVLKQSIDIEFRLGLLDIAASRESLGYDAITKANIITRLEEVYDDLCLHISNAIKSEKTYYTAVLAAKKFTEKIYNGSTVVDDIEWNGRKLVERFDLDSNMVAVRYSPSSKAIGIDRYEYRIKFTPEEKYVYIYNDETKTQKGITKARAYAKENSKIVVLFDNLKFINILGDAEYIKSTSLVDVKRNTGVSTNTGSHFKRYRHDASPQWQFNSMFTSLTTILSNTDDVVIYIPIKNKESTIRNVYEYVEFGKYVGLIDDSTKIVGVKESHLSTKPFKELEKNFNVISLASIIEPKLAQLKQNYMIKNLVEFMSIKKSYENSTSYSIKRIVTQMTQQLDKIPVNSVMYKAIEAINNSDKMIKSLNMSYGVMMLLSDDSEVSATTIINNLYKRYPMIELVDRGIYEDEINKMVDYVNLVESAHS